MTDPHANFIAAIIAQPDRDLPRLVYADWLEENAGHVVCGQCKGAGGRMTSDKHGYTDYWQACGTCNGSECVSNGHAERAEFIRVQVELAQLIGDGSRCPVCGWPIRPGEGCEPDNCCFRPGEHTSEHARWLRRQKHFHALRRRERELLDANYSAWIEPAVLSRRVPGHAMPVGTARSGSRYEYLPVFRRGFVESLTCSWSDFRTHADAIRGATPLREVTLQAQDGDVIDVARWPEIKFNVTNRSGSVTIANARLLQPAGR